MANLSTSNAWQALKAHQQQLVNVKMRDLFAQDALRFNKFSLEAADLLLDYSKNRITTETISLLTTLANDCQLSTRISQLFNGELINNTENRAALHTRLRQPNPSPEIVHTLAKIQAWVDMIHTKQWLGYTQKPITDIVNIGIGGSDLGPRMVNHALSPYAQQRVNCHFVSNVDASQILAALNKLQPATTLFIITSKTFTTAETLQNANTAKAWLLSTAHSEQALKQHFIAVTANIDNAIAYGIEQENILPFWDWVGGRYSLWSAVGLAIALNIGMEHFYQLLAGAHAMDNHFQHAAFSENMPVILALLGIWYINFFDCTTQAILPYDYHLQLFPTYLQQLEMESNGKCVQKNGDAVSYQTASIVWGDMGVNTQHSFHQLLFQGTHLIPIDFIVAAKSHHSLNHHQEILFANCLAQSQALMLGKTKTDIAAELTDKNLTAQQIEFIAAHKAIPGNQPSNTLVMPQLTPHTLGALIALYEHKTFVQSVIWNINCFDQWGVELGKKIANQLLIDLVSPLSERKHDVSTLGLVEYYQTQLKK